MRSRSAFFVYLVALTASCRCGSASSSSDAADGSPAKGEPSGASAAADGAPSKSELFGSLPIAGARLGGKTLVAWLDASAHSVLIASRVDDGAIGFKKELFTEVAWSDGNELTVRALPSGFAIVRWRGLQKGARTHLGALVAADGTVTSLGPLGSQACVIGENLVTLDTSKDQGGLTVRPLASGAPGEPTSKEKLSTERPWNLACNRSGALAFSEDEDNLATVFFDGKTTTRASTSVALPGDEDARETYSFSWGEGIGVARLSSRGKWTLLRFGATPKPERIPEVASQLRTDDDVVALEPNVEEVMVAFTREKNLGCPGDADSAPEVRVFGFALRSPRTFMKELAPAKCGVERGPFWLGRREGGAPLVTWVERAGRPSKASAPVIAFAYAATDGSVQGRRELSADGVAEAGCDPARCYAVVLGRQPGSDGMKPGPIDVVSFP